jgi:outer membrane protein assembly factor BamD (BamD/ComL family)
MRFVLNILSILTLFYGAVSVSLSQTENDVKFYLEKIDKGDVDEVRQALPELIAQYQNTADLAYLEGRLATDGTEAVKYYRSVVENYPKSEWADDALYHIFQYDAAAGSYNAAQSDREKLKTDYPNSPFLAAAAAVKITATPQTTEIKKSVSVSDSSSGRNNLDSVVAKNVLVNASGTGGYTLQVGAFSTSENAKKQKGYFEKSGYSAGIFTKVVENRSLYMVWVGSFGSLSEAQHASAEIKKRFKISPMVIER